MYIPVVEDEEWQVLDLLVPILIEDDAHYECVLSLE